MHQSAGAAVDADVPLMDAGLNSMTAVELRNALQHVAGSSLPSTLAFDHPTARLLAAAVGSGAAVPPPPEAIAPEAASSASAVAASVRTPLMASGDSAAPSVPELANASLSSAEMPAAYRFGLNEGLELHVGHHMYFELEFRSLDVARFRLAWELAFERHAALRVEALEDGTTRTREDVRPSTALDDCSAGCR